MAASGKESLWKLRSLLDKPALTKVCESGTTIQVRNLAGLDNRSPEV